MKTIVKSFTLAIAFVVALSFTANAQIGSVIGKKLKEKAEKVVGNAVDKAVDGAVDNAIGNDKTSQDDNNVNKNVQNKGEEQFTPESVIRMVPKMPTQQQIAEYLCESGRANPRSLKLLANPTTAFLTKTAVAGIGGYAATVGANGDTRYYDLNAQILSELGISEAEYEAMSEEQQQEVARKYADELEKRYYKTMERLGKDKEYNELFERYNECEDEIVRIYAVSDSLCNELWNSKYGNKANPTEEDACAFYRAAMPIHYKAVLDAMNLRKDKQLAIANQIDDYVKKLAEKYPNEVYAGLYNQAAICATSYVAEAVRVTTLQHP